VRATADPFVPPGPLAVAIATGMLCAVKTRWASSRRSAGSVASAARVFAANGSMKPGWLKKRLILSILGASGPTSARARSMSSRYCLQLE
jgi:hypothetical protein